MYLLKIFLILTERAVKIPNKDFISVIVLKPENLVSLYKKKPEEPAFKLSIFSVTGISALSSSDTQLKL